MSKKLLLDSLKEQGIPENIVDAMNKVHREDFAPLKYKFRVYENIPIPLTENSSISQPSTTAFMLKLLEAHTEANILEVGSGSGYVLAVLSKLTPNGKVHGIEINEELVNSSKKILSNLNNVEVHRVNGRRGFLRRAPYDRILVSAAFPHTPYRLVDQLKINGILVAPVGDKIIKVKRYIDGTREKEYKGFSFVDIQ